MSSPYYSADELPDIDDRLVMPGSGYEIDDGKLVRVPPADPPHALCHAKLASLLESHVAADFRVALDMLTRTSRIDDIAPDASVFPAAPHPQTGKRQLEHIAFEIASTPTLLESGRKAAKLIGRGVRRVFAIDVQHERVFEWSHGTWSILDLSSRIEDPVLAVPLPVVALINGALADDIVAQALLVRQNPVLMAAFAESATRAAAKASADATMDAVLVVLGSRGFDPSDIERARILAERNPRRLTDWLRRAATCSSIAELLGS